MRREGCARIWEAEAVQDGRLDGDSVLAFERHVTSCGECRAESAALARLDQLARRAPNVVRLSPLEHRRQRLALLRRANGDLLSMPPRLSWRRWATTATVVVVLTLALAAFAGTRRPSLSTPKGDRLAPLGEILRGVGDPWRASLPDAMPSAAIADVAPVPTVENGPVVAIPAVVGLGKPTLVAKAALAPSASAASTPDAAATFVAAMDAFHDGQYAKADALFVEFIERAPGDARREDAAFLRAVAHARMGDSAVARTLLQSYLDAYPLGLRRTEAERLAKSLNP